MEASESPRKEQEAFETNVESDNNEKFSSDPKDEGVTFTLKFFLFVACIGSSMFGMDQALLSSVELFAVPDLNLSPHDWSWISSAATLGAAGGALIAIPSNALVGRKIVLLISSAFYIAGVIMATASQNFGLFFAGRLIMGIGMGIEAMTIPIYISEVVPKSHRGAHLNIFNSLYNVGVFAGDIVDAIFVNVHPGSWRYMVGAGFIGPAIQFVCVFFFPESPRMLLKWGRSDAAQKSWRKYRRPTLISNREYEEMVQQLDEELALKRSTVGVLKEILFNPSVRATFILGALLSFAQQWNGATALGYYEPSIFTDLGLTRIQAVYTTLPIGFWMLVWTLPPYLLFDRYGRRPIMMATFPIFIIGLIISGTSILSSNLKGKAAGFFIGLAFYYIGYEQGISPLAWAINGEMYELHVRNYGTFGLYAGLSCLFWLSLFLVMPETGGCTLEMIKRRFEGGVSGIMKKNLQEAKLFWHGVFHGKGILESLRLSEDCDENMLENDSYKDEGMNE
ncbi:Galactose-proton symporter [Galdieria sulphuraria]|nr:Galactose-proton symporter [Galdieria sulphuraria]